MKRAELAKLKMGLVLMVAEKPSLALVAPYRAHTSVGARSTTSVGAGSTSSAYSFSG